MGWICFAPSLSALPKCFSGSAGLVQLWSTFLEKRYPGSVQHTRYSHIRATEMGLHSQMMSLGIQTKLVLLQDDVANQVLLYYLSISFSFTVLQLSPFPQMSVFWSSFPLYFKLYFLNRSSCYYFLLPFLMSLDPLLLFSSPGKHLWYLLVCRYYYCLICSCF